MDLREFIFKNFDDDSCEMGGLNNVKVFCGIFTDNPKKAEDKMYKIISDFEVEKFFNGRTYKELILKNGNRYLWMDSKEYIRGYRFKKLILDENIDIKFLNEVILPIAYACSRNDIEIF